MISTDTRLASNKGMQRTALRAAADAKRCMSSMLITRT